MIYQLLLAAVLASATAFSPMVAKKGAAASLRMGFETVIEIIDPIVKDVRLSELVLFTQEIGAQPPLGFFDPLGVLKTADQARFDQLRSYELKHGRVAMLAVLGHILTTAGWRASGEIAFGVPFSSIKSGLAAFDTIPLAGTFQIIAFIGLLELGFGYQEKNIAEEGKLR